jgi:CBS domain-containing protein
MKAKEVMQMTYSNDSLRLDTRIIVRDIMQTNATTIDASASVSEAAKAMCRDEVGSCIVLDKHLPLGIVTEEDMNCKIVARDRKPGSVPVKAIMSTPLITIGADQTVGEAAQMMARKRVRRLPVVDEENVVIGIVTVRDILAASTTINELLSALIEINRGDEIDMGVCDRCGKMSDDLRRVDTLLLCSSCRDEESI